MVSVKCTKGFKTSQDGLLPNDNCHNVDNNEDRDDNDYVNDEDSDNNDNVDKEDGNDNDNVDDEDNDYNDDDNGRSPSILLSKDEPVSGRTKALVVPFFIFTFLTFTFTLFFTTTFFQMSRQIYQLQIGGWQWPCYLPPSFSPGFPCRCYIEKVLTHFMSEKKHLEKITLVLLVSA